MPRFTLSAESELGRDSRRFTYSPLDRTRNNIRLITLLSSSSIERQYSLETFCVTDCPSFIALSYVWGDEQASHQIVVNGKLFKIRTNLWDALEALTKLGHQSRHVWIDAICIDQENIEERGHQVNLMRSIFSTATLTIAWLGRDYNNSNLSLEAARGIHSHSHGSPNTQASLANEVWKATEDLARRPYFGRMWIVQEVLLSRKILVLCGDGHCWWDDMAELIYRADSFKELSIPYITVALLSRRRSRDKKAGPTELHELLYEFDGGHCADPRDRVYALLGLVNTEQSTSEPLLADYSISPLQLYRNIITSLSSELCDRPYYITISQKLWIALDLHIDQDYLHPDYLIQNKELDSIAADLRSFITAFTPKMHEIGSHAWSVEDAEVFFKIIEKIEQRSQIELKSLSQTAQADLESIIKKFISDPKQRSIYLRDHPKFKGDLERLLDIYGWLDLEEENRQSVEPTAMRYDTAAVYDNDGLVHKTYLDWDRYGLVVTYLIVGAVCILFHKALAKRTVSK